VKYTKKVKEVGLSPEEGEGRGVDFIYEEGKGSTYIRCT
jgi:hypothetical protein